MTHKQNSLTVLSVAALRARRSALFKRMPDARGVIQGAVQHQFRKCGREGCRCAQGDLHGPYVYLAVRTKERRGMVYVPADAVQMVEKHVEVARRIEEVLNEISAINLELLARGELD
jgi:hypothetical protein